MSACPLASVAVHGSWLTSGSGASSKVVQSQSIAADTIPCVAACASREPLALKTETEVPARSSLLRPPIPTLSPDSFLTHLLQRWEGRSLDATKGLRCQSREVCPVCCSAYADYVEGALVAACVLLQAKTESEAPFYNAAPSSVARDIERSFSLPFERVPMPSKSLTPKPYETLHRLRNLTTWFSTASRTRDQTERGFRNWQSNPRPSRVRAARVPLADCWQLPRSNPAAQAEQKQQSS